MTENESLIDDILPKHELSLFGGPSGSSKTTWLFQMISDWQAGNPIFGHKSHPEPYVYASVDRSLRSIKRTLKRINVNPDTIPMFSAVDLKLKTFEEILKKADELFPVARVVFIDGFATLTPGGKINDYGSVSSFLGGITRLCGAGNYTIIGIIHATKTKENEKYLNPRERLLGSVAWAGFSETIFYIEPTEPDNVTNDLRRLEILPRNAKHESYEMELTQEGRLIPSTRKKQNDTRAGDFINALDADGEFTTEEIQAACKVSRPQIHRILQRMIENGVISRISKGIYRKEWIA